MGRWRILCCGHPLWGRDVPRGNEASETIDRWIEGWSV